MKTAGIYDLFLSEIFKVRKSKVIYVLMLFPLVITVYVGIKLNDSCNDPDFAPFFWQRLVQLIFGFYQLLYPLIVPLVVSIFFSMELKNNNIYRLFLFPVSRIKIFITKILVLSLYIVGSLLLAYSVLIISGNVLSALHPDLEINTYDMRHYINLLFLRSFVHVIAIMFIQFFLSMLFDGIALPMSFAMMCTIVCFVASKWKFRFLLPYSGLSTAFEKFFSQDPRFLSLDIVVGIIWTILFCAISAFMFCKLNFTKKQSE